MCSSELLWGLLRLCVKFLPEPSVWVETETAWSKDLQAVISELSILSSSEKTARLQEDLLILTLTHLSWRWP